MTSQIEIEAALSEETQLENHGHHLLKMTEQNNITYTDFICLLDFDLQIQMHWSDGGEAANVFWPQSIILNGHFRGIKWLFVF